MSETGTRGTHPLNVSYLVMGLAFVGVVAVWGVVQAGVVPDDAIRWLLPLPWITAGAVGLLASALTSRQTTTTRSDR